jgi:hypothetical protein
LSERKYDPYDPKYLAELSTPKLKVLRENAVRLAPDVVALCNAELSRRKPSRASSKRAVAMSAHSSDDVVAGFHFICPRGRGVTNNSDGTVWTGTWVIAERHAVIASKIGAYVALHVTKSEGSYLQGVVKDYKLSKRERSYVEGKEV